VKYLKLVILATLIAASAACAKVGDPLPPLVGTPEKPQGIDARQAGYTVLLSWTNPRAYVDGSPLADLAVIHVFQNGSAKRPVPASGPGLRQSIAISINDALNSEQTFFVVAETRKGRSSAASTSFKIKPLDVPGQVTELNYEVDQNRIRLTWKEPTEKGELVNGYAVRRSDGGVDTIVTKPPFDDKSYQKGQTYTYSVTAVRFNDASVGVPGPAEATILVTANDKKKPAKPVTLSTAIIEDTALTTWTQNMEDDLAGYRVYSAPSPEGPWTPVADKLTRTSFSEKYRPGVVYAVTAIDQSENESEMSIPPPAQ
jgi:hypothetical protein